MHFLAAYTIVSGVFSVFFLGTSLGDIRVDTTTITAAYADDLCVAGR